MVVSFEFVYYVFLTCPKLVIGTDVIAELIIIADCIRLFSEALPLYLLFLRVPLIDTFASILYGSRIFP